MDWLRVATRTIADFIDRVPLERMLVKPRDTTKDREELKDILKGTPLVKTKETPSPESIHSIVSVHKSLSPDPTTQETVDYQNREIGKILLQMERHSSQKFRINGKACDCGSSKHLLDLEELCEETISMVGNIEVYYKIIELGKELAPKVVPDIVATGQYDAEFPEYAKHYRDLRKELMGSLEYEKLLEKKEPKRLEDKQILELMEGDGTPVN